MASPMTKKIAQFSNTHSVCFVRYPEEEIIVIPNSTAVFLIINQAFASDVAYLLLWNQILLAGDGTSPSFDGQSNLDANVTAIGPEGWQNMARNDKA